MPELTQLQVLWDNSDLSRLNLATVGTAIGHATWRSTTGKPVPLTGWISDF